jgi:ribosomal-protein-alanine N-acetyltransferase
MRSFSGYEMTLTDSPSLLRLDAGHAEAMAALEAQCFSLPWNLRQCLNALSQPAYAAFGAFIGGELAGYVSIYHTPDEVEILNIAVLPDFRRQGLGRRLLGIALDTAGRMGLRRAVLDVREGNTAALRLYAGFGFTAAGRRRRYYADTGEDALVLARPLPLGTARRTS